jgi:hypothetical protein
VDFVSCGMFEIFKFYLFQFAVQAGLCAVLCCAVMWMWHGMFSISIIQYQYTRMTSRVDIVPVRISQQNLLLRLILLRCNVRVSKILSIIYQIQKIRSDYYYSSKMQEKCPDVDANVHV